MDDLVLSERLNRYGRIRSLIRHLILLWMRIHTIVEGLNLRNFLQLARKMILREHSLLNELLALLNLRNLVSQIQHL